MQVFSWKILTGMVCFAAMLALGLIVAKSGKPYPQALLAFHKIAAVLAAVFLTLGALSLRKAVPWSAAELALCIAAAFFFLGSVASGALLTVEKPIPAFVSVLHKAGPALATLFTTAAALLMGLRKG